MKNSYWALTALFLLSVASCTPRQKDDLVIAVKNMNPDMALIGIENVSDMNDGSADTIYPENGSFRYNYPAQRTYETNIRFFENGRLIKAANGPARLYFVYFPGDKIKVEADITEQGKFTVKISGTELYDDLDKFNSKHRNDLDRADSLMIHAADPAYGGDKTALRDEVTKIWRNYNADKEKFIAANPNKELSGYFLSDVDPDVFEEYYNKIDTAVINGKMKEYIGMIKNYHTESTESEINKKAMSEGAAAYDFTLKDVNGKNFTLSSQRGRYVVLDFWGSWCGYCIQGIPDMKSLYDKYKGELEIVGIDCGEPEKQWKKAVKEYSLDWINVYNGENGIDTRYGVSVFPTKIIVGPDGNIIERFEGETPEFYVSVEKIMALTE